MYKSNVFRTSNKNPRQKIQDTKDPTYGIFMGEVVANKDVSRTGRIKVYVPALAQDKQTSTGYFEAMWSSPFAGSTDPKAVGKELEDPAQTMQSYGMWMIPPDLGNHVLIAFGDGNMKYPVIVSCLYQDKYNHMVPGIPAGNNYQVDAFTMPTLEKNKRSEQVGHNDAFRPIAHKLSESITKQGLIFDNRRGPTSSGARRESPSEVFGILTPGPRDPEKFDNRLGGHQFVMDDSITNRQVRIRTAQGQQLLLDDNEGMIYFINKTGSVWMEMTGAGQLVMYADSDIDIRAKGDFNLRADRNINIEAGQDINMKAAGDSSSEGYQGPGTLGQAPTGVGGNFIIESQNETRLVASASIFGTSAAGDIHFNSAGVINNTAGGDINIKAQDGKISNEASGDIGIKSGGNTNIGAGGDISENSGGRVLMNSGGPQPASATDAETVDSIATLTFQDQPPGEIKYDAKAENPLGDEGGVRVGEAPEIATILSELVTLEPWEGHGISDPRDQANPNTANAGSSAIVNNTQPGASTMPGVTSPADVNSPNGFLQGSGNGLQTTGGAQSNFGLPGSKGASPLAVSGTVNALSSSLPAIRRPTLSATGQEMLVGSQTRLTDAEQQFGFAGINNNGRKADITSGALAEMSSNVRRLQSSSATPQEFQDSLDQLGYTATAQPDGTIVFTDSLGNQIIDVREKPLTDQANQALIQAEFLAEKDKIANVVSVPVSDNQLAAMTSMSMHIGFDNLTNSNVITTLNDGFYGDVPRQMQQFSFGQTPGGPVFKKDYADRRVFEAELFQTPDNVPLPNYQGKNVSWLTQARDLRRQRLAFTSVLNPMQVDSAQGRYST